MKIIISRKNATHNDRDLVCIEASLENGNPIVGRAYREAGTSMEGIEAEAKAELEREIQRMQIATPNHPYLERHGLANPKELFRIPETEKAQSED